MNLSKGQTKNRLLAAIVAVVSVVSTTAPAVADLASEREALLTFFNATGGSAWVDKAGWGTEESICGGWVGVSCNPSVDTVTGLALSNRNIVGELPDVFAGLPNLSQIDLRDNHLTGPLPASLGGLSLLNSFEVQRNALVGDATAALTPMLNRGGLVNITNNGLYSGDGSLNDAITGFPGTQTLDAEVVFVGDIQKTSATVTWTQVAFTEPGGYQIEFTAPDGTVVSKILDDKTITQTEVVGLKPGNAYSVVVRSFSEPHSQNRNRVLSDGKRFAGKVIATEDIDTDGDGVGDLLEGKNDEPPKDTDADGIPDFEDRDDDNDGINSADEFDGDTDGDGIADRLDDDDDNDGIPTKDERPATQDTDADGAVNYRDNDDDNDGTPTADELPLDKDENGNGVFDYLDNEFPRTQVAGDEGDTLANVITSKGGGSTGLAFLMIGLLGWVKKSFKTASLGSVILVLLTTIGCSGAEVKEDGREGRTYFGISAGASKLDPITTGGGVTVSDEDDTGGKITLGYEFTHNLALEGFYGSLGESVLSPQGTVDYKNFGVGLVLNPLGKAQGFTPLFKIGVNRIDNDATNVNYSRDEDYLGFGTIGLEYEFSNATSVRLEYDYFAEDAQLASVGVFKKIGAAPKALPAPVVIKAEPQEVIIKTIEVPAPAPVVVPAPAPQIQIPDSDGDGVSDVGDKCPNSPPGAEIDEYGCALFQGNLEGVNFETNSSKLTATARRLLNNVATSLRKFSKVKLEVQAHTDSKGSDRYNQWLSERRAQSVIKYLSTRGVSSSRMIPVGYGERSPIASNKTDSGRAQNRRVVFVVR